VANKIAIVYVAPATLQPNPWNSNVVGPEMERRLDESIRKFGVYKPIIVRELSDGTLQILGGQHRAAAAERAGIDVPIVNLGTVADKKAKALGLADNGRYGEDDTLKLADVLKDIQDEFEIETFLPYTDKDLAGIFAAQDINLDDLGIDPNSESVHENLPDALAARPTVTHELMRFKVPVEDRERVQALFERVIKKQGLTTEQDSLVAGGMALVAICDAAKEVV
jgi:hypothetical protein